MNTINGIPIDWDTEGDNNLFGSLFPEGNNSDGFVSGIQQTNPFSSNFQNSPFGEFWNINIHEWAKPEFGSAKILDKKNIIIADKSSKISHSKADFYNDLINKNLSKYSFVVYSHPDGEKVIMNYNLSKLNKDKPFEILVFIETDDGKFDFGKIVRVKFSKAVIEDLKNKYFEELPWNDNDAQDIAQEFIKRAWATSVSTQTVNAVDKERGSDGFKDLLVKAIQYEDDNQKFDDFSWFILILKGSEYVDVNLPDWCFSLGKWFREKKYLEDKYWNGDLPTKEYTPAFMPDFIFSQKEEDRVKSLKELFNKPYNNLRDTVYEKIDGNDPISKMLKQSIYEKIDKCQKISDVYIENILAKIHIPEGFHQTILKHYHAFELGLYNGILEFIAGICDLTAILLLICREELGFRMTDLLTEKFENFVNALYDNTVETLKKVWAKFVAIFDDFAKWYEKFSEYDGKSYKIIKELGEIIPDILTFVIPVLKASKTVKLAKATEEIAEKVEKEVLEKTTKELTKAEAKLIAKTAKEALENGTATQATKEAVQEVEEKIASQIPKELEEVVVKSSSKLKSKFSHILSSGVIIVKETKKGTYLVGSWTTDFRFVLKELEYPLITDAEKLRKGFDFPLPKGQKFNLLNVSEDVVKYFSKKGGFFNRVNAKWVDAAVKRGEDIIIATDIEYLYKPIFIDGKKSKILTGYGKEVHRFEWKYGYRFDPKSKVMFPPNKADDLKPLTKFEDYEIVD
jgi:hypothetical protein